MQLFKKEHPEGMDTKPWSSIIEKNIHIFAFEKAEFGLTDVL